MSDPGTQFLVALALLIAVPSLIAFALLRPSVMPRTPPPAAPTATPRSGARSRTPRVATSRHR